MADQQRALALVVPKGKVVDFIDLKTFRKETKEEYVRQEIAKSIVREYQYPRDEIAIEFPIRIGSRRARADIVIFPEGAKREQDTVWAVIECKSEDVSADDKEEGVGQLKSYLAACGNAEFGMWTNGVDRFCFRKVWKGEGKGYDPVEVPDLPVKGKSLDEVERPTISGLKAATSDALLFTFRRCHNFIAGNTGLQKPEAFWELLKLIFCKITDERTDTGELTFYATTKELQSINGQMKVKARIDRLFAVVRENDKYSGIFKENDQVELKPNVLAYIVRQLQDYSLLDSETDVKGKAYEEVVGHNLRGDRGEFFTPRNICKMAVLMLDPEPKHLILDPSCGTGGFLTTAMNHVIEKIKAAERKKWQNPESPTERQTAELYRKIDDYARTRVVGIDINPNLVKAAKMNMVMNNDGSGGLYQANSLARPATWDEALARRDLIDSVDMIFTNPPFGSRIQIHDRPILEQFDLAHHWDHDKEADRYFIREPRQLQKGASPEILFVERCVQFLKPGTGVLAIVLPDAILGAPARAYVREWILQQTRVLASIDLHPDTFQPKNNTQTSLLVLQRKSRQQIELEAAAGRKQDYNVFMALADHIGHNKRGERTYLRDENGNIVVGTRREKVREVHNGAVVVREVETKYNMPDDNTEQIAKQFRAWLKEQS